jgi:uncharacterized protein (DUF111 family)
VATPYGKICVKVGALSGRVHTTAPEYEDCRAAAQRVGVPFKQVWQAALEAARTILGSATKLKASRRR